MSYPFFQKNFEISYATVAFTLIFFAIMIGLVNFIAEQVFWGYFMAGNAVAAMFLSQPSPEPYRWPISATYGLLADYRFAPWLESVLIDAGAIAGAVAVAFFCALVLTMAHLVIQRVLYENVVLERFKKYIRKTIFWNTVLVTSTGFLYSGEEILIIPLIIFIIVLCKQHAFNKWVSLPLS